MAFTAGAATSSSATSTGLTVSHNNDGNFLTVGIAIRGSQTVTMTYAGVSMTEDQTGVDSADPERVSIFSLQSPAAGANNLVVSLSGSVLHFVSAQSWTVDSGSAAKEVSAENSGEGTVTNPSVTLPASTGGMAFDTVSSETNINPPFSSAGGDQTVIHNTGNGSYGIGSSYELSPSSGEVFNWTENGGASGATWQHCAVVYLEGGAAVTYPTVQGFERNVFPFMVGASKGGPQNVGLPSIREMAGPHPYGGFERFLIPRMHPILSVTVAQALDATVTTTASFVKQVGKLVSATATNTATMVKQVGKPITANATVTATLLALKVILLAMTATVTSTATMVRQVGKFLSPTVTSTATMVRQVGKNLTFTVTSTATLGAIKVILKAMTATVTTTATMVRQARINVSATASSTASIVKQVGKRVTFTVTSTATLTAQKVILKAITATVTTTATMVRRVGFTLAATVTSSASMLRSIGKKLTATATTLAAMIAETAGNFTTYFFGRGRPRGSMDHGTPASSEYDAGTPGGSSDPGSPSGDFYDPPTPGRG